MTRGHEGTRRVPGFRWIDVSGVVAGLVLPVAMFASSRSAPLVLSVAAALALLGFWREGRLDAVQVILNDAMRQNWARALAAVLAYLALSLTWSHFPKSGAIAFGELLIAVIAAGALATCYAVERPRHLGRLLLAGVVAAALFTIADLRTDLRLRAWLGIRERTFVLNRTVVTELLLLFPLLVLLRGRDRRLWPVAVLAVAGAIWHSESGAALLGAGVAAAAFVVALLAPRLTLAGVFAGMLALLAASPWLGPILDRALPEPIHNALHGMHSKDRVDIWRSYGAAVAERPVLGSGFASTARMADDPVAARVPPERRVLLGAGHPHNAYLQVWAEGGVIGAALFSALILIAGRAALRLRGTPAVALAGFAAGAAFIAAVSHGAWQGWWIAVVGLCIGLLAQGDGANG